MNITNDTNHYSFIAVFLISCILIESVSCFSVKAEENTELVPELITGAYYEFDKNTDYTFSSAQGYTSTSDSSAYGTCSIIGIDSSMMSNGKEGNFLSYSVEEGNFLLYYNYTEPTNSEWHVTSDNEKNVDNIKLDTNIKNGAIIVQVSMDGMNWSNAETKVDVFADSSISNEPVYSAKDIELINGCYYRMIVVYKLEAEVANSDGKTEKEYKRIAEVYSFYVKRINALNMSLGSDEEKYKLGETKKVVSFGDYGGSKDLSSSDLHYGWEIGSFFVSGFSGKVTGDDTVFLKNVDDVVTLWFKLEQDINALNGDPKLFISADPDGQDKYFQTDKMDFGRGMLFIRYTDYQNKSRDVMYKNFLEANTSLNANTKVELFEEGDYEVVLDYEVTKDQLIDKVEHYRIAFKFQIRNGNCMVYTFDALTNDELSNGAVTENGFKLDLAKSRYLTLTIKKEIWTEGADGLTEDTRFNTVAKDGTIYTEEGIYTITVKNKYTEETTEKKIYVGTNKFLICYMTSGYSLEEIQNMVAKGAILYEDGTIEFPEESSKMTENVEIGNSESIESEISEEGGSATAKTNPLSISGSRIVIVLIIVALIIGLVAIVFMFVYFSRKEKKRKGVK